MTFDPTRSHQVVRLDNLELVMRVGIADWEYLRPQKLRISVALYAPLERFEGTSIADCIDYNRIHAHLSAHWPGRQHTDLLETLCEDLIALCFEDPSVAAAEVTIRKLQVYPDGTQSAVTFFRHRPAG